MMFTPGTIWQIAQHSAQDSAVSQRRDSTIRLYAVRTPDPPPPIAWLAAFNHTMSNSNGLGGIALNGTDSTVVTVSRLPAHDVMVEHGTEQLLSLRTCVRSGDCPD